MSSTNRGAQRVPLDNYPTPEWLTRAIMPIVARRIPNPRTILEPASGSGAITRILRETFPRSRITGIDIAPPINIDFLTAKPRPEFDLTITNPPFLLAQEFIERAKLWRASNNSPIVMLLRLNFLGSQKRAAWLRTNTPSVYVTPRRPSFTQNGKTDSIEYAWMIFGAGKPTVAILST